MLANVGFFFDPRSSFSRCLERLSQLVLGTAEWREADLVETEVTLAESLAGGAAVAR